MGGEPCAPDNNALPRGQVPSGTASAQNMQHAIQATAAALNRQDFLPRSDRSKASIEFYPAFAKSPRAKAASQATILNDR